MTVSGMKGGRKYGRLTWHIGAVFSWGAAAECGLIWVVTNSGSQVELWLAGIQLGAIFGTAFGALFLAVGLASNNIHDKKPRVLLLLGISVLFIFIIFPAWALMLPNDGPTVYIYWKLSGTGLAVLTGSAFIMFIIQKYTGEHKSINKFFQLVDKFDRISFRKKCMCAVIIGLIGAFAWEALAWEVSTWEALWEVLTWEALAWEVSTWEALWEVLTWEALWGALTNLNIIIAPISTVMLAISLFSVISQFRK